MSSPNQAKPSYYMAMNMRYITISQCFGMEAAQSSDTSVGSIWCLAVCLPAGDNSALAGSADRKCRRRILLAGQAGLIAQPGITHLSEAARSASFRH